MEVDVVIQPENGPARAERFSAEQPISIGRHASCVLRLEGDHISRTHCVVEVLEEALRVEDRSSNGTLAGETLLRRNTMDIPYGTLITIGTYTLQITAAAAGSALPVTSGQTPPRAASPEDYLRTTASYPATQPPAFHFEDQATHMGGDLQVQHNFSADLAALHAQLGANGPGSSPTPGTMTSAGPPPASGVMATMSGPAPGSSPGTGPLATLSGTGPGAIMPPTAPSISLKSSGGLNVPPPMVATASVQSQTVLATGVLPSDPTMVAGALEKESNLRREIHKQLLENLDLAKLDAKKLDDPSMRPRVLTALRRIVAQLDDRIHKDADRDALVGELADEALGLGPLERFLADASISEIMVVDPATIYVEQSGRLIKANARFTDDERVRAVIERIITPLGRRIDESSPLVDARLKDGSRVNAIIKPLALRGSAITIRKFAKVPLDAARLVELGSMNMRMSKLLERAVIARKNIIVSGGTGSGKTTLLNVLSGYIPVDERIVTIEDAAELQLRQPHVVSLESKPPNLEGKGAYTIRDLVKNSLRMRPDRIVVGECRGGEALDMLQAMNTGHDGSLTTTHANSPAEAVGRIETLCLMSGVDLPSRAIRENIANSIHIVVQQDRLSDGSRKITEISEVLGIDEGEIVQQPIFQFIRTGTGELGEVIGEHRATGYLPSFLDEFLIRGLVRQGEPYL